MSKKIPPRRIEKDGHTYIEFEVRVYTISEFAALYGVSIFQFSKMLAKLNKEEIFRIGNMLMIPTIRAFIEKFSVPSKIFVEISSEDDAEKGINPIKKEI